MKNNVTSVWGPGHFGADPDLSLMDPIPFFSDFKDAKKLFFNIFYSFNLPYPQAHYFQS
jgi:hypothetical protein